MAESTLVCVCHPSCHSSYRQCSANLSRRSPLMINILSFHQCTCSSFHTVAPPLLGNIVPYRAILQLAPIVNWCFRTTLVTTWVFLVLVWLPSILSPLRSCAQSVLEKHCSKLKTKIHLMLNWMWNLSLICRARFVLHICLAQLRVVGMHGLVICRIRRISLPEELKLPPDYDYLSIFEASWWWVGILIVLGLISIGLTIILWLLGDMACIDLP